jgi:hypothetical protein
MVKQKLCGWYLVALGLVLLAWSGRLDLAAVLLPLSILLVCSVLRFATPHQTGPQKR